MEILFRGRYTKKISGSKHFGKWVYGYLVDKNYIYSSADDREYLIDPDTVCLYTGSRDKNRKRIFDGDILCARLDEKYPDNITYAQVVWNGFSWCTRERGYIDSIMSEWDCNNFEVCGNIYDNPELVEVRDDDIK